MKLKQRFAHSLGRPLANHPFVVEFHLALGGMNVDVDARRIHLEKEATERVTPFHERGVITFKQREVEATILHWTPVDEEMLVFARGAGDSRLANETPEPKPRRVGRRSRQVGFVGRSVRMQFATVPGFALCAKIDGDQFLFVSEQGSHAFAQGI
jgi:hypothetical protein